MSLRLMGGDLLAGGLGLLTQVASCVPTDQLLGSRSESDTFTHEADAYIEFTVDTIPSSAAISITFRKQDSNNLWRIAVTSSGSFNLVERVSGSETFRAGASSVLTGGERIVIAADGGTITGYYDGTQAWSYSSASNFQGETDGDVSSLGTGGAVSDIITRPLTTACQREVGL